MTLVLTDLKIHHHDDVIAGTNWRAYKQVFCLQGPDSGSCLAAAKPDSVGAGAAPAGVIAEVNPMIVCKHLVHGPLKMCSLPTNDLLPQAAAAGEDLTAEFVSTVAAPEPRRKKRRTSAATPQVCLVVHHGCVA